jgi:hypothetical protein
VSVPRWPVMPAPDGPGDGVMACPSCRDPYVHVDRVLVSARQEDGPFNEIAVDALSGKVETHRDTPGPGEERRRQRVSLLGWCESCGEEFALVFGQHKGVTYVDHTAAPGMSARPGVVPG